VKRLLLARLVLTAIGVLVWGFGNATSQAAYMYAGMAVLAIALLMRFLPKRWFDDSAS
jgi:hypothetical protein